MLQRHLSVTSIIFIMLISGSLGWRVYTDDLARKYTKYLSSIAKDKHLDPVQLEDDDNEKFSMTETVKLRQGKLFGLSNVTIAEGDGFYAELGYPISLTGILTFPELRANYDTYIYIFNEEKGNVNVYRRNVKFNMKLIIEPIFTKKIILKMKLHDIGQPAAEGHKISKDSDFDKYMNDLLPRVFERKVSLLAEGIKERLSENLTEHVSEVVKELMQASALGFACNKSKESPCNFFFESSDNNIE